MICTEVFAKFIQLLAEQEDSLAIAKDAFIEIARSYHIGKITLHFQVPHTTFTPKGADHTVDIYQSQSECLPEPEYEIEFHTGENGLLQIKLCNLVGFPKWTKEEETDFQTIFDVYFFHLARYRLISQVKKNSMTDYMTGLPNSGGYLAYAQKLFERGEITNYNAYYFNLKGFSLVNRQYGQYETDNIIKRYAHVLEAYKEEDECIGRLGGDNFVALIKKERTEDFLNLLGGAKTYGIINNHEVPVELKAVAGVLEIDDSLKDFSQVIGRAGMALAVAKNVTKQPYVFVTKELSKRVYKEKQIAARFESAILNKEFEVYYQPKVDTDTYMLVGAEALVRWNCDQEVIRPIEFIPVLERDGSICKLDFYMLDNVCRQIREWVDKGIEPVRISVNFSRKHLADPDFAQKIIDMVERYNVDSQYIEIEVTETVDENEQGLLSAFVDSMREHKIATAIDDFGSGYSSMNILRTFQMDVLKFDKSFIDMDIITEKDEIILSNIIRMARELNMDVIAEGVERWKQVEFLHAMECHVVQGFLFARPLKKDIFEEKMRSKQYDIERISDYC